MDTFSIVIYINRLKLWICGLWDQWKNGMKQWMKPEHDTKLRTEELSPLFHIELHISLVHYTYFSHWQHKNILQRPDKCPLCLCVSASYFFSQEQFSWYVGVREVNASGEAVELGVNVFIIWHHIYVKKADEGHWMTWTSSHCVSLCRMLACSTCWHV